jgi:hypothetical protein
MLAQMAAAPGPRAAHAALRLLPYLQGVGEAGTGRFGCSSSSMPEPAAGPGPGSQAAAFWRGGQHRQMCRWVGEVKPTAPANAIELAASPAPATASTAVSVLDSKVHSDTDVRMDAQVIFESCWRRFEEKFRLKSVHVPREVVWLNGAPGAGKVRASTSP